jgi:hypothetical protein
MNVYFTNARLLLSSLREEPLASVGARAIGHLDFQQKSAGVVEDLLDSPFIQTALSLLAPYVQNYRIRQAIKLIQEGIEEEKKKKKKRPR